MRNLLAAFARNTVFANVVIVLILSGGLIAGVRMPRETFPDLEVDMVGVRVIWPGADPEEVEEGICRKIEEAVAGIEGIKRYNTIAEENYGFAQIEVKDNYDLDEVKDRIQNAVDGISTFPADAERPITEEIIFRINVLFVALSSDELTERERKEWAEVVKEEIRSLPEVTQVEVQGARDYEIGIEVSEERLRKYGLTFDQVAALVQANCVNIPGGIMRTEGEEIRLRTIGRKYVGEEFARIVVLARPNGDHITLDQIAAIKDGFVEDQVICTFNGRPTTLIGVLRTTEEDTLAIDRIVREYLARKEKELPPSVHLDVWARMSPMLESRINLLLRNGLIGLLLVFTLLWLFLDIRLSFWASMGMPFSVMGALVVMMLTDSSVNMISLFGLVMVLGIIVDDAIVTGEAIYVARKNGAPALKAAVEGVMEVGMPVVASVTTTIVAFIPLFYVSGFMGKIIVVLPLVVIAALVVSLVECLLCLPAHLSHLPDPQAAREGARRLGQRFHLFMNEGVERFVDRVYLPAIALALRWRYVSLGVAIAVLLATAGLVESGAIKFVFFPELDGNSILAKFEFPNGTPLAVTEDAVQRLEAAIRRVGTRSKTLSGEPLVENMFSLAGARLGDKGDAEVGTQYGTVRVELLESAKRGIYFKDLMTEWEEEVGAISGMTSLTFVGDEVAPPGAPIEIWLQGYEMEPLFAVSDMLKKRLETYEGVYQIQDDFRRGKNEVKLRLKPGARTLGLTVADLARQIHAGYYGQEAIRIQRGRDDVRVRVRYPAEDRRHVSELQHVRIRSPYGFEVPLFSVADIEYGPGYASIKRTDGMRRIVVTAEVDYERGDPEDVIRDIDTHVFPKIKRKYAGVRLSFQGEQESLRESLESLYVGYPLALVGIFVIIATIFRSYIQPLVIMVTVPFGMIGAVFGHMIMGYDLTMMSLFGIVALAGIVVNDAIVLIERINNYLAEGVSFAEAVRMGGARRFRPIFLTTITTIGGLTPLILERDFQAQMLIPMALSITAGILFATILTLFLIPCLLCILNDFRRLVFLAMKGRWPRPEEVEPARWRLVDRMAGDPDAV